MPMIFFGILNMVYCLCISVFSPLRLLYFPLQEYSEEILRREDADNFPGIFSAEMTDAGKLIKSAEMNSRMLAGLVFTSIFDIPRIISGIAVVLTVWRLPYMLKLGEAHN